MTTLAEAYFFPKERLTRLVEHLKEQQYTVIAPVVRDGAILTREIQHADEIARGVVDRQEPGHYRLEDADPDTWFDYVVGPDGPKRNLFPPHQDLFTMRVDAARFSLEATSEPPPRFALLGVRPCDLAAIAIQDRVFGLTDDPEGFRCESEPHYHQSRENALLIAVNCAHPGGTCFCDSWGTGPEANGAHDVALTEIRSGFVARGGTPRGRDLLVAIDAEEADATMRELAELKMLRARDHMGRKLDATGIRELLDRRIGARRWDEIAARCLSCGNCTLVCPTCFCSTVTDANDLSGAITRTREWESCYTHQFSYTTGGPTRNTISGRYRHWLRHKLATWWEQFGTSGCVGCGRCITWCPVGIDLTEEVAILREDGASVMRSEEVPS